MLPFPLRGVAALAFVLFLTNTILSLPAQALGLFEQVLSQPDDPELNFTLAANDEARGNLRHALAAYERLLHADPGNTKARANFNRLRIALSPATTSLHASLSVRGHTEMLATPADNSKKRDATLDGQFSLRDERSLSRIRWRTDLHGGFRAHAEFNELNEFQIGGVTGPVLMLSEGVNLHIAGGGGARYLDEALFYSQATARMQLDFLAGGTRQSVTGTIASRRLGASKFTSPDPADPTAETSDRALVMEIRGKFSLHDNLRAGDVMFIRPRFKYIDVNGVHTNTIFDDSLLFQDVREYGTRLSYYMPVRNGDIYLGAGFSIYQRDFSMSVIGDTKDRRDLYLEPSAHFVMPGIFGSQTDFRIDYRYKHNDSNDSTRDYENHVLGLKLVRRF